MQAFVDWVTNNPYAAVLSLVLGFVGVVLSIVFYIRGRREQRPYWCASHFSLLRGRLSKMEGLEILYQSRPLKSLTVSRFALWNAGKQPITLADVATLDPVRVVVRAGLSLLGAQISYASNTANGFSLVPDFDKNVVGVSFDYFGLGEGVVIDIYHTGDGGTGVQVEGTFKGVARLGVETDYERGYLDAIYEPLAPADRWLQRQVERLPSAVQLLVVVALLPFVFALAALFSPLLVLDWLRRLWWRKPKQFRVNVLRPEGSTRSTPPGPLPKRR